MATKTTKSIRSGENIRAAPSSITASHGRGASMSGTVVHRGVAMGLNLQKEQDLKRFCINTHKAYAIYCNIINYIIQYS